nr:DUF6399 domain-containing protein [uncultured Desulfobacter sp.]
MGIKPGSYGPSGWFQIFKGLLQPSKDEMVIFLNAIIMGEEKALTIIHNFTLKRFDGTTAANRLFGKEFIDLFEWVVHRMDDLPLRRQHKNTVSDNY